MRVLFTTTDSLTLASFLLPLAQRLIRDGWEVHAAARNVEKDVACVGTFSMVHEIDWHRSPKRNLNAVQCISSLVELIRFWKFDIVHTHTPIAALLTRYAVKKVPAKFRPAVIYTAHGFHFHNEGHWFSNFFYYNVERLAARWTDRLIVINRDDEKAASAFGTIDPSKVRYMRGIGVDVDYYSVERVSEQSSEELLANLAFDEDVIIFCCVAEFTANKRQIDLIEALHRLNRSDIALVFAGQGDHAHCRARACHRKLDAQVRFVGALVDVRPLVSIARALILGSDREGLPRSILEAMCLKKAVIGSRVRGTRDLVNSDTGILYTSRNTSELAVAMARLADNADSAIRLGESARLRVTEYSTSRIVEEHVDLYQELLAVE